MTGYTGKVTLRSPSGERRVIKVPGRWWDDRDRLLRPNDTGASAMHRDRMFRRHLSLGWVVESSAGMDRSDGRGGEEEKKKTSVVVTSAAKGGKQSHGGDHASREVKDSPNAAAKGRKPSRGKRSGARRRPKKEKVDFGRMSPRMTGNGGSVYAAQPMEPRPEILRSAEESATLLADLLGRSGLKVRSGISVHAEKLLVALETGDDPVPHLEHPDARPKMRVLVTPDCSGSTQSWNGLGQAWAAHLSVSPDVDVVYADNHNGEIMIGNLNERGDPDAAAVRALLQTVDAIVYLGDGDGTNRCRNFVKEFGVTVVALDSYCASDPKPRMRTESYGGSTLYWVDRVSAWEPWSWTAALKLCLRPDR